MNGGRQWCPVVNLHHHPLDFFHQVSCSFRRTRQMVTLWFLRDQPLFQTNEAVWTALRGVEETESQLSKIREPYRVHSVALVIVSDD